MGNDDLGERVMLMYLDKAVAKKGRENRQWPVMT